VYRQFQTQKKNVCRHWKNRKWRLYAGLR
jgi:hypothetical protein